MKKHQFIISCLLATATFGGALTLSGPGIAAESRTPPYVPPPPPPPGEQDVAQLIYEVKENLVRQSGRIQATHEAVVDAHEDYLNDPNASTYKSLLRATQRDETAVTKYSELVSQSKKIEENIQKAERVFYEETPATIAEIDTGPGGESVAKELHQSEKEIESELKKEIEKQGPSFAEQLAAQSKMLKSVEERVAKAEESSADQGNKEAKEETVDLREALIKAMAARRKAMGEK